MNNRCKPLHWWQFYLFIQQEFIQFNAIISNETHRKYSDLVIKYRYFITKMDSFELINFYLKFIQFFIMKRIYYLFYEKYQMINILFVFVFNSPKFIIFIFNFNKKKIEATKTHQKLSVFFLSSFSLELFITA